MIGLGWVGGRLVVVGRVEGEFVVVVGFWVGRTVLVPLPPDCGGLWLP